MDNFERRSSLAKPPNAWALRGKLLDRHPALARDAAMVRTPSSGTHSACRHALNFAVNAAVHALYRRGLCFMGHTSSVHQK